MVDSSLKATNIHVQAVRLDHSLHTSVAPGSVAPYSITSSRLVSSCSKTVSYTHLDVYKRQVVLPWSTCPIVPMFTCGFVLSYTAFAIFLIPPKNLRDNNIILERVMGIEPT